MIRPALGTGLDPQPRLRPRLAGAGQGLQHQAALSAAGGQVKVNNARASLFVLQGQVESDAKKAERGRRRASACPDGVFVDRSNPRREVIIATKDIINLGGQLDLSASCR